METKYQLSTIKDIFDKVPLERIDVCLSELATMIKQTKALNETLKATAGAMGIKVDDAIEFPEVCTWIDDGKGEVTLHLTAEHNSDLIATVTTKPA
jgi:hypothetical protein